MKAVTLTAFGSADNFAEIELPTPDVRKGEVRIKVKAASFNPVDWQVRVGRPESQGLASMILGRDLSGVIDAIGEGVEDFSLGDRVFSYICNLASNGAYAEFVSVPSELVAKMPARLSFAEAAAVPVVSITAALALRKAQASEGKRLFAAGGSGGVGTIAIRLANRLGVRNLITTAGSDESRAYLVAHCGLNDDQIVDYNDERFAEIALKRNGGPFDIALDFVGGRMLSACCRLLAVDGNLASITDPPSTEEFDMLFHRNASFHSIGANAYSLMGDRTQWIRYRTILDELGAMFDKGEIAPPPITILGDVSRDVVKRAHEILQGGRARGKLVMTTANAG